MSISSSLADLNYQRNNSWKLPFDSSNSRQAIYAFNGDVYRGIDAYSIAENKIDFLQNTVRIISGLYGLLKPLDLIQPYRLEMGTRIPVGASKNLYEFWGNKITESVNARAKENSSQGIVNLASVEYFSSVKIENLDLPVYSPVFKDFKNGLPIIKILIITKKR